MTFQEKKLTFHETGEETGWVVDYASCRQLKVKC